MDYNNSSSRYSADRLKVIRRSEYLECFYLNVNYINDQSFRRCMHFLQMMNEVDWKRRIKHTFYIFSNQVVPFTTTMMMMMGEVNSMKFEAELEVGERVSELVRIHDMTFPGM